MKPSEWVIGILVMGFVAIGFGTIYMDTLGTYAPYSSQTSFDNSTLLAMNKSTAITSITDRMADTFTNMSSKGGGIAALLNIQDSILLFRDAGLLIMEIPNVMELEVNILLSSITGFQFPEWVSVLIIAIIGISIIFGVISIFIRRDI